MKIKAILLLAIIIGALRPFTAAFMSPMGFQIYKDMAHVFMGALLVLWLLSWSDRRSLWRLTFWLLNAVEVASALLAKRIIG